jgi:hypothetical protein
MPSFLAIAAGPNSARSCLICAASMLMGRPLYLPAAFAFALPLQHDLALPGRHAPQDRQH